jgi:cyclophilin family peptidyl-prolyl cis-trans isomerase
MHRRLLVRPRPGSCYFHTTGVSYRGTKHLDWFHNALDKETSTQRQGPPPFPLDPLHGRARARAYLDFAFGAPGGSSGSSEGPQGASSLHRVVFELADDIVPVTVDNFLSLCARPPKEGYVGSQIFRAQKGFAVFGGDWKEGTGRGRHSSIPSRFFPDENFIGRHTLPGVLSMASSGVHSNSSIFFITLAPALHLGEKLFGLHCTFTTPPLNKLRSPFFSLSLSLPYSHCQ